MATSMVTFTHDGIVDSAGFTDGNTEWAPGSLRYDDSHIWTLDRIEAELADMYPKQTIVIIDID